MLTVLIQKQRGNGECTVCEVTQIYSTYHNSVPNCIIIAKCLLYFGGELRHGWQMKTSVAFDDNAGGELRHGWQMKTSFAFDDNTGGELRHDWQMKTSFAFDDNAGGEFRHGWQMKTSVAFDDNAVIKRRV